MYNCYFRSNINRHYRQSGRSNENEFNSSSHNDLTVCGYLNDKIFEHMDHGGYESHIFGSSWLEKN